jgi:hypothetical protein
MSDSSKESLREISHLFLSSVRAIVAFVLAVIFALAAMALLIFRLHPASHMQLTAGAALVLISGFLFRYAVVMGPQHEIG